MKERLTNNQARRPKWPSLTRGLLTRFVPGCPGSFSASSCSSGACRKPRHFLMASRRRRFRFTVWINSFRGCRQWSRSQRRKMLSSTLTSYQLQAAVSCWLRSSPALRWAIQLSECCASIGRRWSWSAIRCWRLPRWWPSVLPPDTREWTRRSVWLLRKQVGSILSLERCWVGWALR